MKVELSTGTLHFFISSSLLIRVYFFLVNAGAGAVEARLKEVNSRIMISQTSPSHIMAVLTDSQAYTAHAVLVYN